MTQRDLAAPAAPGLLIGLGLGGFVDGILIHQILQWHNMLSARIPPVTMDGMRTNMTADGYFHALVWLFTLAGVWRLWAAGRAGRVPSGRRFAGQVIAGWGLFNLVEGVIDHHLLQLHHVHDMPRYIPAADWVFLAVAGVGVLVVGTVMARGGEAGR